MPDCEAITQITMPTCADFECIEVKNIMKYLMTPHEVMLIHYLLKQSDVGGLEGLHKLFRQLDVRGYLYTVSVGKFSGKSQM